MPAKPKPIQAINVELNITINFKKALDASKYLGCSNSLIAKICKGKNIKSWGWTFRFLNENETQTVTYITENELLTPLQYLKKKIPWNKDKKEVYKEESLIKMREAKLGNIASEETKKKQSKAKKEYYKKNAHVSKNVPLTAEHKKRISKSLKAMPSEKREKLNKHLSNKIKRYRESLSQEAKDRIRKIQKMNSTKITYGDVVYNSEVTKIVPMFELKKNTTLIDIELIQQFKCKCSKIWDVNLTDFCRGKIKSCGCEKSQPEKEIYDFIVKELNIDPEEIKTSHRPPFMENLELDIYLPNYNIAIEHHGLAFHSDRPTFNGRTGKTRSLHRKKYILCKEQGISLIQIFEDEWRDSREIVKSILKNKLKQTTNKIFARKTEIKELQPKQTRMFFDKNHIAGYTFAPISAGLVFNGEIVCVLALRKPYTKKHKEYIEIARFASKLGTQVVGGFSKLLKYVKGIAKQKGYKGILTYADLRFGTGEVYAQNGFKFIGITEPNYFYEKRGIREGRFEHRKNNDPEYVAKWGTTEKEQNNKQGWYAIYDAGSNTYLLDFNV